MTENMMDKGEPVAVELKQQCEVQIGINDGTVESRCFYCKKSPCYELSLQGKFFIKNILFDENRQVCGRCYSFMQKTGSSITKLIRLLLKVDVFFRKKNT